MVGITMRKILYWGFFLLLFTLLSGCSSSKKDLEIESLKKEVEKLTSESIDKDRAMQNLNLKLSKIKQHNEELNSSLEKANRSFSEEYKRDFKKEIIKKYMEYTAIPFIFLMGFIIYLLFAQRQNKKDIVDFKNSILEKEKENEKLGKLNSMKEKEILNLNNTVKVIEGKRKEGIKNQIVTKLEEYETKRIHQLARIKGD